MKFWFVLLLIFSNVSCSTPPEIKESFSSCNTEQIPTEQIFQKTNQSFLKIIHNVTIFSCNVSGVCIPVSSGAMMGSSFVVKNLSHTNSSVVFTAAHLCLTKEQIIKEMNEYLKSSGSSKVSVNSKLVDVDGKEYTNFSILLKDDTEDICALLVEGLTKPHLSLSKTPLAYGETVYNLASPNGVYYNYNPVLYSGIYFGDAKMKSTVPMREGKNSHLFSIPTVAGSSGSPVINKHGKVVSVMHSRSEAIDTMGMGSTYQIVNSFYDSLGFENEN